MHVRKNAASMSSPEISKFMNALLELKKKPAVTVSGTPTNVYDQFVAIHDAVVDRGAGTARGNGGHRGPAFCSWHREYILRFEQQLQIIDSDVFLPYWSWESLNASDTDSIFVDEFMGPRQQITTGYLSETPNSFNPDGWMVDTRLDGNNNGIRLTRNSFSGISTTTANAGKNSIGRTPFTGTNGFRNSLEGAHNSIHGIVGGHMTAMTSPNDPIFFLHHANVDRLWAKWQLTNPGDVNYPSTSVSVGHALNDLMWPWDGGASQTNRSRALPFLPPVNSTDLRRPRDVLDIEALDYTYDDAVGSSGWSSGGSITLLNPPTNFRAQNPTTNTIDLVWGPPNGGLPHTGYVIRRRDQNTGNFIEIHRPSNTDTNYTDQGLQSNTPYNYEIRSIDATSESAPSTDSETTGRCFIITATYGSELAPQAQFVHEFYYDTVLKSKFKKSFEKFLQIYFKVSPSIANLMYRNKPFKFAIKYTIVVPFLAISRVAAFLVGLKRK